MHAVEHGVRLLDTADAYGGGRNEELVGAVLAAMGVKPLVATKFGWVLNDHGAPVHLDSSPARVRLACEASLRRLRVERIDLYLQHRVDPLVPIEETAGEVARLVDEGKVAEFGLSEASVTTVRRAHAVLNVAALQSEYSLFWREPEVELIPVCDELGIAFIAYSPLGRGLLTGALELGGADVRGLLPRFSAENLRHNLALSDSLSEIARRERCTVGQLALAWLLNRHGHVIPIPGTRSVAHLEENLAAATLKLRAEAIAEIEAAMPLGSGAGPRHTEQHLPTIDR